MIAHWIEWKRTCALDRCSAEARAALCDFAGARFGRNLRRYMHMTNHRDPKSIGISSRDAWHLMETHFTARNNRAGKRYKDWLFARTAGHRSDTLKAIESGAALLMRDVTREYLRKEVSRAGIVSLDESRDETPSIDELLPREVDPASEVALREYERLATIHAAELFEQAERRQKAALYAGELGISLSDADITRLAGCGTTALRKANARFMKTTAGFLKRTYSGDDADSLVRLALMTINTARKLAVEWKNAKNGGLQNPCIGGRGMEP